MEAYLDELTFTRHSFNNTVGKILNQAHDTKRKMPRLPANPTLRTITTY